MKRIVLLLTIPILLTMTHCAPKEKGIEGSPITQTQVEQTQNELLKEFGEGQKFRIERGVSQVANLWRQSDGSFEEFKTFCEERFVADEAELETLFNKLSFGFEVLSGNFLKISKDLMRPLHLDMGPVTPIDMMFGGFSASAHLSEDLYTSKIAFVTALNFPFYSLNEKTELGPSWTRQQWAYARMGDRFTSRVPAELQQNYSRISTDADAYIDDYNIYMANLRNEHGEQLFPEGMKLITHWGLRDELKSQYANTEGGLERQQMIYQVMQRIIDQSIPQKVISNDEYIWNPISNEVAKDDKTVDASAEPNTRYKHLLNLFKAIEDMDAFYPNMPSFIQRRFESTYEIPVDDVEKLFIDFVSSKQVREAGKLISERLGRPLQPFDIWYDGFKSRSSIPAEVLDNAVAKRFSSAEAYQNEIPNILTSLGWSKDKAKFFQSKIAVEGSRGAGHAWGAAMREDIALLRTRIGANGMDYKGFNIAMHEFGHTVEQTITLHDVDYYTLTGVPNTAFTEALAFIFQKRDLDVLGIKDNNPEKVHLQALDNLWQCYEIMGVSLVDINLWRWLYENPHATPAQLKEATISIAKDIWNKYYADVFGSTDEPILAVYSHMISNPLYLSAYPMGLLIDFQLEQHIAGKHFANEIQRIFEQGSIIPQLWMKGAVGSPLSIEPTLNAAEKAISVVKK
ncbi:gluzincin family metallopeptidase [Perlabentimonas gracilis]|uniref:hypothetical protein n=1 Tax=Perlabentimonas gracilis TaxID=2715279 RepID=UPI00140DBE7A|nr:hypothetical protein [Perlabentimonas gracilis]NHB67281.1 hypothetical protein [Perlabentimonas gracilis]